MNDEPRQKLQKLIVDYGRSLCNDPNRCEALLKDHCGVHKREIFVLVSALRKKVTDEMLTPTAGMPLEIVLARLRKRLEDELAMTAEAAQWAVESWAMALGLFYSPSSTVKPSAHPEPPHVAPKIIPVVLPQSGALAEFIYKITTEDIIRLESLIKKSNKLPRPRNLSDLELILQWAKTNNPIEAYFLAEFKKIPHKSRNFSDNTLESKLKAWLDWAARENQ
jgi:hypothetical protein